MLKLIKLSIHERSINCVALNLCHGKHQDEGSNVGLLRECVPCVFGRIVGLCETSCVFTSNWSVHELSDDRCAVIWSEVVHMLDESRRFGSILTRFLRARSCTMTSQLDGSLHDCVPSIKEMPTSWKITLVCFVCHQEHYSEEEHMFLSQGIPQDQNTTVTWLSSFTFQVVQYGARSWRWITTSDGQRRLTHGEVPDATMNATDKFERKVQKLVMCDSRNEKRGQIVDRGELDRSRTGTPQFVAKSDGSDQSSCFENSTWPSSKVPALLRAPTRWPRV